MQKRINLGRLIIYICLILSFVVLLGSFSSDVIKAADQGGNCICAEYRSPDGKCFGATTRLCEGPPECKGACG